MGALLFDATTLVDVAASQTASVLTVGKGTLLKRLIIVPEAAASGAVTLIDGKGVGSVSRVVFEGGAVTALTDLRPHVVDVEATASADGADAEGWQLTTGATVHVIAIVQAK